jgi:Arc/MetJ-type ribon-helix-helix transcriptional regulator
MSAKTKRSTIYLEEHLHKALRLKAAETDSSMSDVVNDALRTAFGDDAEDLASIRERKNEPVISFESFVSDLKSSGRL